MTYQLTTLPNGLRVATEMLPGVESVAIAISVDVGARHEDVSQGGMSHLLEHMAFKGTTTRSARDIAEAFDNIGGQFNAYTSMENTVYYAKVLKEHSGLALEILADILQNSVFDEAELKREQDVVLQEIAMNKDSPEDVIVDLFDATVFPDQPMGRPILGTAERVPAYTREHLKHYMAQHYGCGNMVVSAAGNIGHDKFVTLAERVFRCVPASTHKNVATPARYVGGQATTQDDLEQAHLMLGFEGVPIQHPDYYALQLFTNILGGGMSSRLFQEIREKRGLAYHVSASSVSYADVGVFSIYTATDPKQADALPSALKEEVEKLIGDATEAELTRVKNQQKAELIMSRENTSRIANWIGRHLLVYGKYIPLNEVIERVERVTLADVKRVGKTLLDTPQTLAILKA